MMSFFKGLLKLSFVFFYSKISAATQLEFIADYTTPKNFIFEKTIIGGLSGLYFKDNRLWAVSDDRGQLNEPRIYSLNLSGSIFSGSLKTLSLPNENGVVNFNLIPFSVLILKKGPKLSSKRLQIDAESLVPFRNGWLVSSEGDYHSVPRKIPSLMYFDSQGQLVSELNWPDQFVPNLTGKQKKGLRGNYAFEGLSLTPDQKYFFAIHEAPLIQDNLNWHSGEAGNVHLLRFRINPDTEKLEIDQDILYKLDVYTNYGGKVLGSGVSEILALSNDKVLILERAVIFNSTDIMHHESRIYEISISHPSEKKLILDLSNIKKMLKTTKDLDNFEGMALGPIINSQPTLLMVSDDNFNPLENTLWLLFKLTLEPQ
jgi:hypothetical protein